jgi:hypothetical protein
VPRCGVDPAKKNQFLRFPNCSLGNQFSLSLRLHGGIAHSLLLKNCSIPCWSTSQIVPLIKYTRSVKICEALSAGWIVYVRFSGFKTNGTHEELQKHKSCWCYCQLNMPEMAEKDGIPSSISIQQCIVSLLSARIHTQPLPSNFAL